MLLSIDSQIATADILQESWDQKIGGKWNSEYKSKEQLKFLKYGPNLIVEEALIQGGKVLKDGSLGGIARAEGAFYQYKFVCKR